MGASRKENLLRELNKYVCWAASLSPSNFSIIESSIILLYCATRVNPLPCRGRCRETRLRSELAVAHPAEIVSYQKMLGALQDAGNTTTIASYLRLPSSILD